MDAGEFGRVVLASRRIGGYGWINFETHYSIMKF
jgi:hypothetical protein